MKSLLTIGTGYHQRRYKTGTTPTSQETEEIQPNQDVEPVGNQSSHLP
jgi:hypothetical protein